MTDYFVAKGSKKGGSYHSDKNCARMPESRPTDQAEIDWKGLDPCGHCINTPDPDPQQKECPLCGEEEIGKLPSHIPEECESV